MTRLQTLLLLVLILVAAIVVGQADWIRLLPVAAAAIAMVARWFAQFFAWFGSLPVFIAIVPSWVWWVAFGILMSMWCGRGAHIGRGRCRPHRRHWETA